MVGYFEKRGVRTVKVIIKTGDILERILVIICTSLLFFMVAAIIIDVFSRNVFNKSIGSLDDLVAIAWVWVVFLLLPVVVRHGQNLVADFLSEKYNKKGKKALEVSGHLIFLAFMF
jgi:TRAP-type C4-dicarboxylate transport system permease small subunit